MDQAENTLVTSSHIAGAMNYPSTTQALFALIVMIIVLLFILVYCCWGTFSCARQDEAATAEDGALGSGQRVGQELAQGQMVIVPFSNMLYVGDPESRRIYQIPLEQDKPPAYSEVFSAGPPPPYTSSNSAVPQATPLSAPSFDLQMRGSLPDLPPPYEVCLSQRDESKEQLGSSSSTLDTLDDVEREQEQSEAQTATSEESLGSVEQTDTAELPSGNTTIQPPSDQTHTDTLHPAPSRLSGGVTLSPAQLPSLPTPHTQLLNENTTSQNRAQSS